METPQSTTFRARQQPDPGAPGNPPLALADAAQPSRAEGAPDVAPAPDATAQRLSYLFRRTSVGNQVQVLKKAIHEYRGVLLP